MDTLSRTTELLWIGGLAVVPLALIVAVLCRWPRSRPATRHALWTAVLVSFLAPLVGVTAWRPAWFDSSRVLSAAERVLPGPAPDGAEATVEQSDAANRAQIARHLAPPASFDPGSTTRASGPLELPALGPVTRGRTLGLADPAPVQSRSPWEPRRATGGPRSSGAPSDSTLSTTPRLPSMYSTIALPRASVFPPTRAEAPAATPAPAPAVVWPAPVTTERPTPHAAAAPAPTSWAQDTKSWLLHLLLVRDEIARMPPFPVAAWIVGVLVVLCVWALRSLSTQRLVNRSAPADAPTTALVSACATLLGLRRAPRTVMTDERVCPTVVCGLTPRLILPVGLWDSLDGPSRHAVITHELAHLRRMDHLWCWLVGLVALVYWWHPVAWWARRRLREEADASCDAWVTSVLPGSRRAYAEALVATKSYLSLPGRCALPGLGVMSGRAQKLARRIKMVMTQRVAPRASLLGALVALGVATVGLVVMPALACPPESKESPAKVSGAASRSEAPEDADKAEAKAEAKAIAKANKATARQRAQAAAAEAERAAQARAAAPKGGQEFFGEAPALEAMRRGRAAPEAHAEAMEQARREIEKHRAEIDKARRMQRRASGEQRCAPSRSESIGSRSSADTGTTEVRVYQLSRGKLEKLYALMARSDVPILVQRQGDGIAVHATPNEHRAFRGFIQIIEPDGAGSHEEHADHDHEDGHHARGGMSREQAEALAQRIRERVQGQVERQRERQEALQRRLHERHNQHRERSEMLEQQADELRDQAERLAEQAEEAAEGFDAEELAQTVARLTEQAEAMAAEAQTAESLSELSEEQIEALNDRFGELAEQIEEQVEDRMEALRERLQEAEREGQFEFDGFDVEGFMEQLRPLFEQLNLQMESFSVEPSGAWSPAVSPVAPVPPVAAVPPVAPVVVAAPRAPMPPTAPMVVPAPAPAPAPPAPTPLVAPVPPAPPSPTV